MKTHVWCVVLRYVSIYILARGLVEPTSVATNGQAGLFSRREGAQSGEGRRGQEVGLESLAVKGCVAAAQVWRASVLTNTDSYSY